MKTYMEKEEYIISKENKFQTIEVNQQVTQTGEKAENEEKMDEINWWKDGHSL